MAWAGELPKGGPDSSGKMAWRIHGSEKNNVMLFRRKNREPLVLKSLPTTAKLTEESKTLADKYAAQVEWMREKGITGSLTEPERKPPRSVPKSLRKKDDV